MRPFYSQLGELIHFNILPISKFVVRPIHFAAMGKIIKMIFLSVLGVHNKSTLLSYPILYAILSIHFFSHKTCPFSEMSLSEIAKNK
jgi:hypothetical protein